MSGNNLSFMVGASNGILAIAIPADVINWLEKLLLGVCVALVTGAAHGLASHWTSRKQG